VCSVGLARENTVLQGAEVMDVDFEHWQASFASASLFELSSNYQTAKGTNGGRPARPFGSSHMTSWWWWWWTCPQQQWPSVNGASRCASSSCHLGAGQAKRQAACLTATRPRADDEDCRPARRPPPLCLHLISATAAALSGSHPRRPVSDRCSCQHPSIACAWRCTWSGTAPLAWSHSTALS